MQANNKRHILPGREFDDLFPPALGATVTIKQHAVLEDSLGLIAQKIPVVAGDTKKLSAVLKGNSAFETSKNIWNFCYRYIQYEKDEDGKEQIRRPSRTWLDRENGVDCDCFSVFIGTILHNLHIPFKLRITKYYDPHNPELRKEDLSFSHIYVVVPTNKGEIIIDPVHTKFNEEVTYAQKRDIDMKLEYLNGPPGAGQNIDSEDLEFAEDDSVSGYDVLDGKKNKPPKEKDKSHKPLAKIAHGLNKFNLGVAPLRAGVLAAMKMNLFKIGSRIRFAYLSEEEAKKRGFNMSKFARLKKVKEKLEKIFFGAGGKESNLKKAILEGKGNKDKAIPLNGPFPQSYDYGEGSPLHKILGDELMADEMSFDIPEGSPVQGLGEPVTAAVVGVASTVLGAIAALLKSIGDMKSSKEGPSGADAGGGGEDGGDGGGSNLPATTKKSGGGGDGGEGDGGSEDAGGDGGGGTEKKGIIPWIKANPVKTALIGVTVLGVGYLGYRALTGGKKAKAKGKSQSLSGLKKGQAAKRKKAKTHKSKTHRSGVREIHLR